MLNHQCIFTENTYKKSWSSVRTFVHHICKKNATIVSQPHPTCTPRCHCSLCIWTDWAGRPFQARALFAASVKPRLAADLDASWARVRDVEALAPAAVRVDAQQRASLIALIEAEFCEFAAEAKAAAAAAEPEEGRAMALTLALAPNAKATGAVAANRPLALALAQRRHRSLCDFQVSLTRAELSATIGEATCAHLHTLFGANDSENAGVEGAAAHPALRESNGSPPDSESDTSDSQSKQSASKKQMSDGSSSSSAAARVDEIVLRRVHAATAADERHIAFHTDASARTMQVVLNDGSAMADSDKADAGGRLVFLSAAGALVEIPRVAGAATIHDASIVHGVTTVRAGGGVRYSLFFLQA